MRQCQHGVCATLCKNPSPALIIQTNTPATGFSGTVNMSQECLMVAHVLGLCAASSWLAAARTAARALSMRALCGVVVELGGCGRVSGFMGCGV
jgi:hypothetical protein